MLRPAALGLAVGATVAAELKTLSLIKAVSSHLKPGTEGTVTHGRLTMNKSDVPSDAPAHFPWSSSEDFFRNSGLSFDDMDPMGEQKCTSQRSNSNVYTVSDGQQERCFVVITPTSPTKGGAPVSVAGRRSKGGER